MTDEQFVAVMDLAMGHLHRDGALDLDAFVSAHPDATGEVEGFLRSVLAWCEMNRRSSVRIRRGVLDALPGVVERVRSRPLGDLFKALTAEQARAFGIPPLIWRKLCEDSTPLAEMETLEQRMAKARTLRVDVQTFLGLFNQLADPLRSEGHLHAARHEDDPTKED